MKRIRGVHVWFLLSMAAALALPPLLLRARPDGFEAWQRRVGQMRQSERDRVERNFNEFLAMDASQRNHYRDLHRRLADDVEQAQGTYKGVFDNYTAWLQTIESGYRREQLRTTTDPGQRLQLMRQVLDEESEREMRQTMEEIPGFWRFRNRRLLLPPDRYQAMMSQVEDSIDLTRPQKNELEGLDGFARTYRMFEHLADGTPLNVALTAAEVRLIIERAGIEALIEAALEARAQVPGDESRRAPPERDPRRAVLIGVIVINVRREFDIEVHQRRQPGDDDLRSFLNDLDDDERDELLRLQPDEFNARLSEDYVASRGDLDWRVVMQGIFRRPEGNGGSGVRPGIRPNDPRPRTNRPGRSGDAPPE